METTIYSYLFFIEAFVYYWQAAWVWSASSMRSMGVSWKQIQSTSNCSCEICFPLKVQGDALEWQKVFWDDSGSRMRPACATFWNVVVSAVDSQALHVITSIQERAFLWFCIVVFGTSLFALAMPLHSSHWATHRKSEHAWHGRLHVCQKLWVTFMITVHMITVAIAVTILMVTASKCARMPVTVQNQHEREVPTAFVCAC